MSGRTDATLFDVEPDDQADDERLDLEQADWASCRYCGVLSTAAGITRFEHGPESQTCEAYIARYGRPT